MSCDRDSRMSASPWGRQGGCAHWRPFEVAAIVLGFFIFWPIGLALLFMKLWGRSFGYRGDLFSFAAEQGAKVRAAFDDVSREAASGGWAGPSFMRSTGNVAFDEWREGELARLEEERRKLAEAERDFAEHISELRRARDREEFDSFMRARKGGAGR
ncbi:DUF2852 domain-containing protein [Methylocystis sp. IM3]|uniref:DUF2852 domain-containing protein n=1 Tax=unclassified Methylocystis TaxID=2625913 RepID=UPI0030F774A6